VVNDVFVVSAMGGEAKRLTFDNCQTFGVTWTADGHDILFSSMRGGQPSLWRVPASGGTPHPIAGPGSPAKRPSVARKGDLLAYQQVMSKDDIARIDLVDREHSRGPSTVVISEKGSKLRPRFSPDGTRITFESDRLGSGEIWICDSTGSNCAQLTSLHGTAELLLGRQMAASSLLSSTLQNMLKSTLWSYQAGFRGSSLLFPAPITSRPVGRETESGFISPPSRAVHLFNCGRFHSRVGHRFR
jgi:WD40-like Beta Propeller Repeat